MARVGALGLGLALGLALTSPAVAAPHCTPAQTKTANAALKLSAAAQKASIATNLPFGLPKDPHADGREILVQDGYVVEYDDALRDPVWSAEAVGVKPLGKVKRIDCFRRDPRVGDAAASLPSDYSEPIFDQGHMSPAGDQTTSVTAMVNTTLMSNMTPQYCHFNRGIWEMFEEIVRSWVDNYGTVYVLTGSVFKDDPVERMKSNNGKSRVAVPSAIYKLLAYKLNNGGLVTLAVELPNTNAKISKPKAVAYLKSHVVTLGQLKDDTGLKFFPDFAGTIREATADTFWDTDHAKYSPIDTACH